ncbi:hypothetical protein VF14_04830 [Nostoc linckia z18]|uniref:Transmembrane protein n=2 Tax=Nostoc linckia TaxID=92942 RepID=A0A9Q6EME4_NOSLI|nr:hypothetical protein [Nostoc linckia]PHK38980.1 hypothetical protein VF12_16145 [Nostoc linckia z15]PHK47054.1 hypothetical protein VF13_07335 [Nostoc linckia z16]PHJ67601.1 hypothetical protein VF02_05320 [Nostoc linckia z1]PHJ72627.1 hypothetical protein VF05_04280 [Nostoc linckia z3]PHJ73495.1 hypothetical protein VF03_16615 [Nostoc linckia z2]
MRQNIIIRIESDSIKTNQVSETAAVSSITEVSEQVSCVGTPLQTDRWIYRIVVGALALTLVSCIGSTVWLQANDKKIPEILIGLGTGALGGLAGLLAPTPTKEY